MSDTDKIIGRPHTLVRFADPHMQCGQCRGWVTGWHDSHRCGCTTDSRADYNAPCGHHADVNSVCPSWGPVDGCRCLAHLGTVDHPVPQPGYPSALLGAH